MFSGFKIVWAILTLGNPLFAFRLCRSLGAILLWSGRGRVDSTDQLGEGYHVVTNYLLMDTEPPVYSEPTSSSAGLGSQRIHERVRINAERQGKVDASSRSLSQGNGVSPLSASVMSTVG